MRFCLRASAAVHHHAGNLAVDDLLLVIEVEHVYGRHLGGGAAWARRASGIGVLDQVSVRVLLHEHVLTLARTVVGFVALGRDDPVPAESLKVHCERVAAAAGLGGVLVAVQTQVPPRAFGGLENFHLQERLLEIKGEGRRRGREEKNREMKE